MAFVKQAYCTDCSYESERFVIGNGRSIICFCQNCQEIVDATRDHYKFTLGPCPNCNSHLSRKDAEFYHQHAIGSRELGDLACHVCKKGTIVYRHKMSLYTRFHLDIPESGTIVHGHINEEGRLSVPNILIYDDTKWNVKKLPTNIGSQFFEMKFLSCNAEEKRINSINFEFIQTIDF